MSSKKRRLSDLEEPEPKKVRLEEDEEEGEDPEDEDDDIAKLYCIHENASDLEYEKWKLDDNKDTIHAFFTNNTLFGKDKWPETKEFTTAVKIAQNLEKSMTGVTKRTGIESKWFGFVLVPAYEDQEAQQAFEEALGLCAELLEAEAGIYYEDLDEDAIMFVQEEEDLSDLDAGIVKKMNKTKDLILDQLDDYFTVGFCSEVESCYYPEFWGGQTEDGIIVGVLTTLRPEPIEEDQ